MTIGHLVSFLEAADGAMHQVVAASGMGALRENPERMGTSVGMLRRAASTLACLAKVLAHPASPQLSPVSPLTLQVPGCRPRFMRHQQRLLQFTMSTLMDSRVAAIVADVLWQLQQPPPPKAWLPPPPAVAQGLPAPSASAASPPAPASAEAPPSATAAGVAPKAALAAKAEPTAATPLNGAESAPTGARLNGDCGKALLPPLPLASSEKVSV